MTNHKLGTLYFIPVTLGDDNIAKVLPLDVVTIAQQLDEFIVENEKTARHFLGTIKHSKPIRELVLKTLNEHTADKDLPALLGTLMAGKDIGLMSEAGCPGIADPGAKLAALAHQKGIRVAPLVGPSSILLSLMASGLNGQRFTFLGYLPSDKAARITQLKEIEKHSKYVQETQLFIETPYRNQHMLEDILANCQSETKLCIACNISLSDEYIVTKRIKEWKQATLPDLHKKPTVFLLLA
ncbi:MAG: SAM-dependent methyltransferase [Methylotenera sp.]|nr:SAM-dependent methyltransferase [Methylotenera sp.]MDO9232302.1 SAM-dependent methyltransferase [Methylotenera sp.]MDO9388126.1 SAM-dependent methyltransferase [Methylotenera sp.]MDP2102169.1 SAM-dependent methyltransferase [Methylotenera sp.]MDP2281129.1 SAM-dependent methyltransferase [Methylotenera sp.]